MILIHFVCTDNDSGSATESVSKWIRDDNIYSSETKKYIFILAEIMT